MSEKTPNDEQQELIDSHEGIYKVDAGAGTGKTFSITRRYAEILTEKEVEPEDLLLLTYTNSAADEMKERIINYCSYDLKELREAPISTFHSLCRKLVTEEGFNAPQLIGVDEQVAGSTNLIDNDVQEEQEFNRFINDFITRHPEYNDFYRTLSDYTELLDIVKELAAKGVIPEEEGWYRSTDRYLDGDFEKFWSIVEERNQSDGRKSDLKDDIQDVFDGSLQPDAPSEEEVVGDTKQKTVTESYLKEAFEEYREHLKQFIHDVYHEYLEYCLSRNYLNFGFVLVLGFVLLCEDDEVREEMRFEYTLVDEFQDTNEIQFKLALLLSRGNISAVGDWKQSIYSFQYVEVENIMEFDEKIRKYREELNSDRERIGYSVEDVKEINLVQNYRSSQEILNFSKQAFSLKGKKGENVEEKDITGLDAVNEPETSIQALESEEEIETILAKIEEIVGNEEYIVDGETPEYSDIAVMARGKKFGLELRQKAEEYGIPVSYEGGVKLFRTRPSKLLLAWLRILEDEDSREGWSVVLERAGYNFGEIKKILDDREQDYPENMKEFRHELQEAEEIAATARKIFTKYGIEDGFTDKIIEVLQNTFSSSYRSRGDMIQFIEDCIGKGEDYDVDNSLHDNTVTVQTMHSAKGLEYPIVFISDINNHRFPSSQSDSSRIFYSDAAGLRHKKQYLEETQYVHDNWKGQMCFKALSNSYDEERRLMYVAMTRAEQHLLFTADTDKKSKFFKNLDIEKEEVVPELEEIEIEEEEREKLKIDEPDQRSPIKKSVHAVMDLKEDTKGRGKEFGIKVHEFAERYARGEDIEPRNKDEENVKEFIDSLEGELRPEVPIKVPDKEDGRKVVYNGVIDLLHITDDKVDIIDWKTDRESDNEKEYQKQLDIYEKGISKIYGRQTQKILFYTHKTG